MESNAQNAKNDAKRITEILGYIRMLTEMNLNAEIGKNYMWRQISEFIR